MKLLRLIGALLLVPAATAQSTPGLVSSSQNPAVVHSVRGLAEPSGPVVEIISSRPLVPVITKLGDPPRLVIDLPNAWLSSRKQRLDFRGSEINGIRVNQFQRTPPIARVVVDLSKPVAYTWDAAGNRLMVRIHTMEEAVKPVPVPAISPALMPRSGGSGGVLLAGSRVPTGSAVTAGADTAVLRLGRGGEVLVCPRTTVSVTTSKNGRTLMLGMSTGALEAHYFLDAAADSILTPDFRILLAGPGEFHFGVSADSRGDTCIQSLPGNTAAVIVSELLGGGTYQVKAAQQVMFHSGKLSEADTAVPANCGCPTTTSPLLRTGMTPDLRPVPGPETAALPASKPNDVHVQVDAPIVFRASDPAPAPAQEARLLPLRDLPSPAAFEGVALPPKPARHGFFGKLKGFFSTIFG